MNSYFEKKEYDNLAPEVQAQIDRFTDLRFVIENNSEKIKQYLKELSQASNNQEQFNDIFQEAVEEHGLYDLFLFLAENHYSEFNKLANWTQLKPVWNELYNIISIHKGIQNV